MDKQAISGPVDSIAALAGVMASGPPTEGMILFDRYRVIREIGRGGMGLVLLASDAELDTDVALKLVPDLLVHDEEAINDLKQEVLKGTTLIPRLGLR